MSALSSSSMRQGSSAPPDPPMHALTGTAKAVLSVAAVWAGLSLLISSYAYVMSTGVHVLLVAIGAWLVLIGVGIFYARERPSGGAFAGA